METLTENQTVILENRKSLIIDGVSNIESFTDNYMELNSSMGVITVEGRELKIEALDQQTGKIYIVGEISGFFYSELKSARGFWNKIFK